MANFLNAMGITAFVVKYRFGPRYRHPVELGDAQRAIRMVRARAKEFGVLPDKIGVLGFSAGGHWHPLPKPISIPATRKLRIRSSG
jgi:acetyl esterase/lipase